MDNDLQSSVAALDLGSNSFHMIIGRVIEGELSILDRLRDPVRIAAGLDADGELSDDALERMLESLRRFGQRLLTLPDDRVRAIGTAALRRTRSPENILVLAGEALGHPIEVLPGAEEARLIYLGVAHDQPHVRGNRLVIDIGGGSTELILGEGFAPIFADSLAMGCVTYSMRYFPDGKLTRKGFAAAQLAAHLELQPLRRRFCERGWSDCIGSSGTIGTVSETLLGSEWTDGAITLKSLEQLRDALVKAGRTQDLSLPGVSNERKPVLAGGLAILIAVFEGIQLERMEWSKAALREGVLHDLLGRIRHEDVRDRTVRALCERYHVDETQAANVERTALVLLKRSALAWNLEHEECELLLRWAARVHEIGLAISYSGHHRHGAYILENSNLPGFSRQERQRLSGLVRGHRRKLPRERFAGLPERWRDATLRLCLLLRLAVRLERTRSSRPLPEFELDAQDDQLHLHFPAEWLESHPLTRADLEEEVEVLARAGYQLRITALR